jgi:hypothetical protein
MFGRMAKIGVGLLGIGGAGGACAAVMWTMQDSVEEETQRKRVAYVPAVSFVDFLYEQLLEIRLKMFDFVDF